MGLTDIILSSSIFDWNVRGGGGGGGQKEEEGEGYRNQPTVHAVRAAVKIEPSYRNDTIIGKDVDIDPHEVAGCFFPKDNIWILFFF